MSRCFRPEALCCPGPLKVLPVQRVRETVSDLVRNKPSPWFFIHGAKWALLFNTARRNGHKPEFLWAEQNFPVLTSPLFRNYKKPTRNI